MVGGVRLPCDDEFLADADVHDQRVRECLARGPHPQFPAIAPPAGVCSTAPNPRTCAGIDSLFLLPKMMCPVGRRVRRAGGIGFAHRLPAPPA
jgi:hypothetical protein